LQPQSDLVKGNLLSSIPACFHWGEPCRDLIVGGAKSFCYPNPAPNNEKAKIIDLQKVTSIIFYIDGHYGNGGWEKIDLWWQKYSSQKKL